jgi:subtilisin family serine protease
MRNMPGTPERVVGATLLRSFIAVLAVGVVLTGCRSAQEVRDRDAYIERQIVFTIPDGSRDIGDKLPDPLAEQRQQSMIARILRLHDLKKISQWSVRALGLRAVVAEVTGPGSIADIIRRLRSDKRIESADVVRKYRLLGYNDAYFHMQASFGQNDLEMIHGLAMGRDVTVGVIDTGMDRLHPELKDRIVYSANFVAHDANRFDEDDHGTAVAGVISSEANNELGIVGVAPAAKIMAFKACWQGQNHRDAGCDSVSLARALVAAIGEKPDIINLSLAGPDDLLIRRLIKTATDRGIIVVAAAEANGESFPASMDEVIAVSESLISATDVLPVNSVLAHGTDVLTTTPGSTYAFRSGSSMASAYVSGIAALLKEQQPNLTSASLMAQIRRAASAHVDALPIVDLCATVARGDGELCKSTSVARNP